MHLLFGSIAVETSANLVVFELPNSCKLSFEVINGDIALVDLVIKAPNGDTLVSIVKNFIEYKLNWNIKARRRPGKFQLVLTDQAISLIPSWITSQHLYHDPTFFAGQECTLLDIEVIEPGLVRIYGVWMDKQVAVVSSPMGLSFIRPGQVQPITMAGEGAKSVLKCTSVRLFELFPPVYNASSR